MEYDLQTEVGTHAMTSVNVEEIQAGMDRIAEPDGIPTPDAEAGFLLPKSLRPRPVPKGARLDHPHLYFNRELSWLDFNWRVFYQAMDDRHPLMERLRFLAITASNLDEFFRKRVGGLKRQKVAGVRSLSPDGRTPSEQLDLLRPSVRNLFHALSAQWEAVLRPALRERAGIHIRDIEDLSATQKRAMKTYYHAHVYPIMTPLAVDPGHPFPFISNLSLSCAIVLRNPARGTTHFARLKIPTQISRWVPVAGESRHFVPLEQVVAQNAASLFRGMELDGIYLFRVTRNADIRRNEEEAEDLLAMIAEELRERRFAPVVRLEVERAMPTHIRQFLMQEMDLGDEDVYEADGLMDLTAVSSLADLEIPQHQFTPWEPLVPRPLQQERQAGAESDIFSIIRKGDVLVHHPYESFTASVQRLLEEAAEDPHVLAIKQTLYRTGADSPVVEALMHAAERGKQVVVMVEVKARFDEENNIEWGQLLEKAGVHVTYGLVGLKTHAKTALVVREEEDGLRIYCHLGTGNYHSKTARLYTDVGYLTCRPALGADVVNLFHYLTGYAPEQEYAEIVVAPLYMRDRFIKAIHREVASHRRKGDGRIIAKMNGLDDEEMIQELYRASQAGVQIDLIIRGHCRLRPGLPKYSENIRVMSIIGRFLEHSRIYYFHNGGDPRLFIASADWQRRNLEDRVETAFEVPDPDARQKLIEILELALKDNRLAWDLHENGQYVQRRPAPGEAEYNYQNLLMEIAKERNSGS